MSDDKKTVACTSICWDSERGHHTLRVEVLEPNGDMADYEATPADLYAAGYVPASKLTEVTTKLKVAYQRCRNESQAERTVAISALVSALHLPSDHPQRNSLSWLAHLTRAEDSERRLAEVTAKLEDVQRRRSAEQDAMRLLLARITAKLKAAEEALEYERAARRAESAFDDEPEGAKPAEPECNCGSVTSVHSGDCARLMVEPDDSHLLDAAVARRWSMRKNRAGVVTDVYTEEPTLSHPIICPRRQRAACELRAPGHGKQRYWRHDVAHAAMVPAARRCHGQRHRSEEQVNYDARELGEYGRFLASWHDAGYTQEWIAERIGKQQTEVSKFIRIGTRLSTKVTEAIERTGDKHLVGKAQLVKLARLYDDVMREPLHEKQVEELEKLLGTVRARQAPEESRSERIRVHDRAKALGRMQLPGHAKPYVRAIYEYLFNDKKVSKPNFNWK